ncbi:hypothetical protein [Rhizobium phage RHph_X2_26]|nr:hypothetical protein [Rhizobium phage RHph_X2_26]
MARRLTAAETRRRIKQAQERRRSLAEQVDDMRVNLALRGLENEPLPPRLWESARLKLQRRLREATGEPTLVLTYEVPKV